MCITIHTVAGTTSKTLPAPTRLSRNSMYAHITDYNYNVLWRLVSGSNQASSGLRLYCIYNTQYNYKLHSAL